MLASSAAEVREKNLAVWTQNGRNEHADEIPKVYTDYDELLANPEIDFVYIGFINSVHYDLKRIFVARALRPIMNGTAMRIAWCMNFRNLPGYFRKMNF